MGKIGALMPTILRDWLLVVYLDIVKRKKRKFTIELFQDDELLTLYRSSKIVVINFTVIVAVATMLQHMSWGVKQNQFLISPTSVN